MPLASSCFSRRHLISWVGHRRRFVKTAWCSAGWSCHHFSSRFQDVSDPTPECSPVQSSLRLPISPVTAAQPLYTSLTRFPSLNPCFLSSHSLIRGKHPAPPPPFRLFSLYLSFRVALFYIIHVTDRISPPSLPPCKSALLTISTSNPCCWKKGGKDKSQTTSTGNY